MPGNPTLARAVRHRGETEKTGEIPLRRRIEHREVVAGPAHDLTHDADDQRCGGDHEGGVRREIRGDLDTIAARPNADTRRLPICREQHDGRGKEVGEEQRELLHAPARAALVRREVERDVVVRAESDETNVAAMAGLPPIELAAKKEDALPQRATGARRAPMFDLD